MQARTRQFAKRQATWFRGLAEVRPVPIGVDEDPEAIARRIVAMIEAARTIDADSLNLTFLVFRRSVIKRRQGLPPSWSRFSCAFDHEGLLLFSLS